jgi:CDP-6-deoxy-D-xylo-4-hexulose-3-dehydrase
VAKALVIGASGQVGGALLRVLERSEFKAVGTFHAHVRPGLVPLDLGDGAAVCACLASVEPAIVFVAVNNPGGVDWCEDNPDEAQEAHVGGMRRVLEAAAPLRARLVFYSTDYVFDGTRGPYREDDELSPISVYGRAKRDAERLVRAYPHGHLILRTTAVVSWDRSSRNFAMTVWNVLSGGKPLRVPNDQWGNPTLAEFLAEASVRLVQAGAEGTFNVSGKTRVPRSDLAVALAKAMALDPALIEAVPTTALDQRAKRPLQGGFDTRKLTDALGTEPLDLTASLQRLRRQWRADTYVAAGPVRPAGAAEKLKAEILEKVREYHAVAHVRPSFVPGQSRVNYAGRVFGPEEMVNLVDSSLDFWLTMGPYGDLFETRMKKYFRARDFALVNSGSSANLTAVMALMSHQLAEPLKAGDEVITPAVTFPTTVAPLVHAGLIPVFVDCEVDTCNIDPAQIEAALSPRTRAIMVPHTLGNPCDLDVIGDIVQRRGLLLVEDCCDALGSTFRGRLVGTFGDLGTLSFFPAHHITMGEGGGVVVNSARLSSIVRSVRDWGRDCWCAPGESNTCGKRFGWQLGDLPCGYDHKYTYSNLGYNFKPTDLQAAIGVAQMDRLPGFTTARRANFQKLYDGLQAYSDRLILPRLDPRAEPSWFALPLTVQNGVSRRELVHWLEHANIETREVFGGNILKQPGYRGIAMRQVGSLNQTDRIMRDTFFIGVYPGLTDEMIAYVLDTFAAFFASGSRAS